MADEPDDDAWASIVANFGERAELTDEEKAIQPIVPVEEEHEIDYFVPFESDDGYEPPPVERVGLADGPRGAAWIGVLGAPLLFMVALLTGISIPHWLSLFAVVAFLAGLGYLIATMRHHDDDPWDDGARV